MGAFSVLFILIGWTVPILIGAACVRSIWLALTLPRGSRRGPACEACGYDVRGLSSFLCPECGTDIRQGGVITPVMEARRRGSLTGAIGAWTLLMLMGGIFLISIGYAFLSARVATTVLMPVAAQTQVTPATPDSGAFARVDIVWTYDWQAATPDSLAFELNTLDGRVAKASVDPISLSFRPGEHSDGEGEATPAPVDISTDAILAWFAAAGVDVAAPGVRREADDLRRIAEVLAASPGTMVSGVPVGGLSFGPTTYRQSPVATNAVAMQPAAATALSWERQVAFLVPAAMLIVYVAGVIFIVLRRGRLMRPVAA